MIVTLRSLKNKFLITVIPVAAAIFLLISLYQGLSTKSYRTADAKDLVNSITDGYAGQIERKLDESLLLTSTLSETFYESLYLPDGLRDSLNKRILVNTLKNNDNLLSVWLQYELKALNPTYNKRHGRQRNLAYFVGKELVYAQNIADTTNEELSSLYYDVKRDKKAQISEPYYDQHTEELKGIPMVSPITPLVINGEFIGMVGVDVTLAQVKYLVQSINPFESSKTYLIAPNNRIVAHSNETLSNKDLFEVYPKNKKKFENALSNIRLMKKGSFLKNENGTEQFVSYAPISVGDDGRVWALITETPTSVFTEKSDKLMFITLLIGLLGLTILFIVIYISIKRVSNRLKKLINYAKYVADGNYT